ncbi:MAG: SGNH/GDSL hydrolase family protein [Pyrinomonadaceae bacterium]
MTTPLEHQNQESQNTKRRAPLRKRLIYAAAMYFVFLLILAAVEVGARIFLPHANSLDLFVATPQQKMQVANEQQSAIFEGDPLLLWRLKPNLNHVVWDFTVLSTNAQGIRANYPTNYKANGTIRILCLGDSVTFGYRVPVVWPEKPTEYDPEWLPFPMLLEDALRKANVGRSIEVFPMAVPGYTSHQGLAWLRRDIDDLQPDFIIVSFGWNDASLSDVPDVVAIRANWYAVAVRWLIDHSQAFAHATRWLREKNQTANKIAAGPVPRVGLTNYVNNFLEIVRLAQSHKAAVVVLGAPYRDRTTNPVEAERMREYRAALRSTMQREQVPYLEILELTEAAAPTNDGFFGELIHPNHIGHRLIASDILKLMGKNRMLGDLNIPDLVP